MNDTEFATSRARELLLNDQELYDDFAAMIADSARAYLIADDGRYDPHSVESAIYDLQYTLIEYVYGEFDAGNTRALGGMTRDDLDNVDWQEIAAIEIEDWIDENPASA